MLLGHADGLPLIYTSSPGSKLHRPEKVGLLCVASAEEGGALALKALPLPTPLCSTIYAVALYMSTWTKPTKTLGVGPSVLLLLEREGRDLEKLILTKCN